MGVNKNKVLLKMLENKTNKPTGNMRLIYNKVINELENNGLAEWPSLKNLQTIHAGEGVEKREPSCTVGGNVNWYSHYGEQYGGSLKN